MRYGEGVREGDFYIVCNFRRAAMRYIGCGGSEYGLMSGIDGLTD